MENHFREKIVELLKSKPQGLTILEIANSLDANRNTITKYIYELSGAGVIVQRKVGTAKLCFVVKNPKKKLKFLSSFLVFLLIIGFLTFSPLALAQVQSHPLSQIFPQNVNLNLTAVNITNVSYVFFGLMGLYIFFRFLKFPQIVSSLISKLANFLFISSIQPVTPNSHEKITSSKPGEPITFNHFNKSIRIARAISPQETILRVKSITSEIFCLILTHLKLYTKIPITTLITAAIKTLQPKLNCTTKLRTKASIKNTNIPTNTALLSFVAINPFRILLNLSFLVLLTFSLFSFVALAQVQSHPLSQIFPQNVNLNLTGVNITNVSYVFFGNNSIDTYLFRSGINTLRTDSHLVVTGGWINGTSLNLSSGFIVTLSGNVGIGTTIPDSTLTVSGNLSVSGSTNSSIDGSTFFIDATNNRVGIGTTNPSQLLHLANAVETSQLRITSSGGPGLFLTAQPSAGPASVISHRWEKTGGSWNSVASASLISIGDSQIAFHLSGGSAVIPSDSTNKLTIDSSGNVGIGTTNPQSLLHVNSTSSNVYIQLPVNNTAIASTDCDANSEWGRMIAENGPAFRLWVCYGTNGWKSVALS